MDKKWKILLSALGIGFVCLVVWVVTNTPDAPPPVDKIEPPMTMEYVGNTISEEVNGVKIWDLTAEKVIVDVKTQNAELRNLTGHFYQQDGKSIELRAKYGNYDNTSKNVHVEGDVTITTDDNAKLTSVKLDWINADNLLIATDKVQISKDDIRASGDRAESSDGFKNFKLKGRAHIIKGIKDEQ